MMGQLTTMSAVTQLTKLLTQLVDNTGRIADEMAKANQARNTLHVAEGSLR